MPHATVADVIRGWYTTEPMAVVAAWLRLAPSAFRIDITPNWGRGSI